MAILIQGLGLVNTEKNLTDNEIVDIYRTHFEVIQDVFNKDPATITAADAARLGDAMDGLKDLASNGATVTTTDKDGNPIQATKLVTRDMARQIDLLQRSMTAAGMPGAPDVTGIQRWQDLGVEGVDLVITRAAQAIDHNRSLQSLIELEYVRTGNEVLSEQLEALNTALSSTKASIEILTELQDIRNLLEPEEREPIDLDSLPSDLDDAIDQYNEDADEAFKDPIDPIVDYRGKNPQDVINDVERLRRDLAEQLTVLDKLNPPQIDQFGAAVRDDASLAGKINLVLEDMQRVFVDEGDGLEAISQEELESWLIDNQDIHIDDDPLLANTAGDIQRNITGAIQAATNLNDQQKEDFRRYMFVFEEFYKSAAAMLSRINQMIEKMAQNAGR